MTDQIERYCKLHKTAVRIRPFPRFGRRAVEDVIKEDLKKATEEDIKGSGSRRSGD